MKQSLRVQAEQQLAKRSVAASLAQIVLVWVVVLATRRYVGPQWFFFVFGGLVIACSLLRLGISMSQRRFYPQRQRTWNVLFSLCIVLSGLGWGALYASVFRAQGPLSYPALICIVTGTGISAGMTTSLSPRQNLVLIFNALLIGLPLFEMVTRWMSSQTLPLAVLFVVYYFFLAVMLRIQNRDYWSSLISGFRLDKETDRLRSVLDTIPGLVSWVGPDLVFHGVNQRYAENYGGKEEDYIGRELGFRNNDARFKKTVEEFASSLSTHTGVVIPMSIRGEERWNLLVMRKTGSSWSDREIYLICIDVHDLRKARAKLEAQRIKAERSAKLASLGELASNVAHEIRNPLTAITMSAEFLRKDCMMPFLGAEKRKRVSETIIETSMRIDKIITSLTRFSRAPEGEPDIVIKVAQVVSDSVALLALQLEANGVTLIQDVPTDVEIRCRPVEITQVLVNLISNAIDACKPRDDRWIRVEAHVEGGEAVLSVSDSGVGIAPQIREHIFEPFFTTKPAGVGTGIGLSISRKIIKAHHGRLELDPSASNTTFVIRLPRVASARVAA